MIDMLKRHEVQVLRRAAHTWKEIPALSGVSVRTVRRIAAESEVATHNVRARVQRFRLASAIRIDNGVPLGV